LLPVEQNGRKAQPSYEADFVKPWMRFSGFPWGKRRFLREAAGARHERIGCSTQKPWRLLGAKRRELKRETE
jgi:hypothetical protein